MIKLPHLKLVTTGAKVIALLITVSVLDAIVNPNRRHFGGVVGIMRDKGLRI